MKIALTHKINHLAIMFLWFVTSYNIDTRRNKSYTPNNTVPNLKHINNIKINFIFRFIKYIFITLNKSLLAILIVFSLLITLI